MVKKEILVIHFNMADRIEKILMTFSIYLGSIFVAHWSSVYVPPREK